MLNYGNYHGKCMIINTNSSRYNRQLYDYGVFSRPPKYMYLCRCFYSSSKIYVSVSGVRLHVPYSHARSSKRKLLLVTVRSISDTPSSVQLLLLTTLILQQRTHHVQTTCSRTSHPHTCQQISLHICNPEFTNPTLPPTSIVSWKCRKIKFIAAVWIGCVQGPYVIDEPSWSELRPRISDFRLRCLVISV